MKVFLIGFIGAFIGWLELLWSYLKSWPSLQKISETFQYLVVIAIGLVIFGFVVCQIFKSSWGWVKHKFKRLTCWIKYKFGAGENEGNNENASDWQCLLITGDWGSGKTHYYKTNYKDKGSAPDIYISCFSASRAELVAQIIQQQLWGKLLTLNGLLAKLMESNWQLFMPTKRTVVFDDVERLHTDKIAYQDLIGIVDYLKNKGKCRIILICNQNQISKEADSGGIFNLYMERVVDDIVRPPKISLKKLNKIEQLFTNGKEPNRILTKCIEICQDYYDRDKLKNLRVFETIIQKLARQLEDADIQSNNWDDKQQEIYAKTFGEQIKTSMNMHYLYFVDHNLFVRVSKISHANKDKPEHSDLKDDLKNTYDLNLEEFKYNRFKHTPEKLLKIEFDHNECIQFVLQDPWRLICRDNLYAINENELSSIEKFKYNVVDKKPLDISKLNISDQIDKYKVDTDEIKKWRNYITHKDKFFYELVEGDLPWIQQGYFQEPGGDSDRAEYDLDFCLTFCLILAELGFEEASTEFFKRTMEKFPKALDQVNINDLIEKTFKNHLFWFLADGQYEIPMDNLSKRMDKLNDLYDEMLTKFQQTPESQQI